MTRAVESLRFAVRPRVVARHVGQLLLVLAVLSCVPAAGSLSADIPGVTVRYLATLAVMTAIGLACARMRCAPGIQVNEALVVTALAFGLSAVAMSVPLAGYGIPWGDALFEAVSGVTTTGLSTLASVDDRPGAFQFARAWLQWVGGLGIVVLALALLLEPGTAARRLGFEKREMDDLEGGTRAHAKRVLAVYAVLTGVAVGLLWLTGLDGLDAVVHALAAVSTGGFAPRDASLADLDGLQRAAVMAACLAGAISFSWYAGLYDRRRRAALFREARLHALLAAAVACGVAILAFESCADAPGAGAADAALMALSAQTTAGFSSVPVTELSAGSKLALVASMGIGGQLGSTAGGLKILRALVLARLLVLLFQRAAVPRSTHVPVRVGSDRVDAREIESIAGIAVAYVGVVLLSWAAFLACGHDPLDSLFEVVSAVGTVGLSAGLTGPDLEPVLKGVLCLDMLMGRVEVVAFIVLLLPGTWIGRRRRSR